MPHACTVASIAMQEKVRDLLAPDGSGVCKTITIRETQHGGILLAGGSEEVPWFSCTN